MKNKKIVLVGGTDGIGRALAEKLVANNEVLIIGRSQEKAAKFTTAHGKNAYSLTTDLSLLNNIPPLVKAIKEQFEQVDIIIHSADLIRVKRQETKEGLEISIALNYYSRVLFNQLMLTGEPAYQPEHIIHIAAAGFPPKKTFMENLPIPPTASSIKGHTIGQWSNDFYGIYMKGNLQAKGVKINILNPGNVSTEIRKKGSMSIFIKVLFSILATIIGKSRTPESYAEIPLAILNNKNADAEQYTLINKKGKGIKGNKNVNNPSIQQELYNFTTHKINAVLETHKVEDWL